MRLVCWKVAAWLAAEKCTWICIDLGRPGNQRHNGQHGYFRTCWEIKGRKKSLGASREQSTVTDQTGLPKVIIFQDVLVLGGCPGEKPGSVCVEMWACVLCLLN